MSDVGSAIVAPALGTIICFGMWLSPMKAVLEARRTKSLNLSSGPLNPIPFAITVANCIAWTTYGCQKRDLFLLFANGSGLTCGIFYILSVLPCMDNHAAIDDDDDTECALERLAEQRLKLALEVMVVGVVAMWALVSMAVFIILDPSEPGDAKTGQTVVSAVGVVMGTCYYASPLTTMYTVVKQRNR